eukprot:TRINITY_DN1268_c0_g1_i1.p1 TRINITY_DN1268_c0_g1~~TRINITY_DN1268_c0_g1_i1.p1  ORF type:complete len:308 (+),score=75.81 TRINITY_DN1268_c0_g1_i1:114-926(+)
MAFADVHSGDEKTIPVVHFDTTDEADGPPPLLECGSSVYKECPCKHNEWDNIRVKKGIIMLRCRVCQLQWKTPSRELRKCRDFEVCRCTLGAACPLTHINWHKSCPTRTETTSSRASCSSSVAPATCPTSGPVAPASTPTPVPPQQPQQQQKEMATALPAAHSAPVVKPFAVAPPRPVVMVSPNVVPAAHYVMAPCAQPCYPAQATQPQFMSLPQAAPAPATGADPADGTSASEQLPSAAELEAIWHDLPSSMQQLIKEKVNAKRAINRS